MTNYTFDKVKIKFEKFLSSIGNILTCEKEINTIQNKLRRHFNTTVSDYLCSNDFLSSLDHIQNLFNQNNKSNKYYTLLVSFDEQLKKHSIKPLRSIPSSTEPLITTTNQIASTIECDVSVSDVQETIEHLLDQCCNILSHTLSTTDKPLVINNSSKHERRIIRLERRLCRLSRIIRELEEKEMTLEEMEHCDLYEVESNLKKQACQIHAKLAELKSQSSTADRILHRPITLNECETGHRLINKDLQDMVNQSKNFPSFSDVLDTVEKANNKYKLNLKEEMQRNLAEKSFKVIGKEIKNRRMADFQDIMYSRLPENFNIEQSDPALNNVEIEKVLSENHREAVIKTEQIFEEFARIEPDLDGEINIESTENESAVEHEEQQEEEEEIIIEPQIEYDAVDILPPFSTEPLTPIATESNSIEAKLEISLNERTLTILSTASLPVGKTNNNNSPKSSTISNQCQVETLQSNHKQNLNDNEIIYQLYKQRLTNNKRPITQTNECNTNVKKSKQQPEVIVLD